MENYLLCGEIGGAASLSSQSRLSEAAGGSDTDNQDGDCLLYKGRRKGTVEFVGIWKHSKSRKNLVANGVCIMHSLDQNNILKFLEWYETPKHIWVITELATGGSLADIIEQDGHIPLPHLNDFISDIANGLHYLHSRGILYCDLQPKKILLDNCEALKLSDFTLAQSRCTAPGDSVTPTQYDFKMVAQIAFGERSFEENKDGLLGGGQSTAVDSVPSPFYAAPELFDGGNFDEASDLWSMGVIAYELFTGRQPFHGNSSEELVYLVLHGVPELEAENVFGQEITPVVKMITFLLQKSPKCRSWKDLIQNQLFILPNVL